MSISTIYSTPNDFWMQNGAIRFELNALGDADKISVSLAAGAVIVAWRKGVIDYNAGLNYRAWVLSGAPTSFDRTDKVYVYVRLSKTGDTAQLVFPYEKIPLDPALYLDESDESGEPAYSTDYYYILLGALTPSIVDDEAVWRYWSNEEGEEFSTGVLDTDQYRREQSSDALAKMFRLNEETNTIEAQKDLSFVAGARLVLFRMKVLGKESALATINRIATTQSLGEETDDSSLITSLYADRRFIRRDINDETNTELTVKDIIAKQAVKSDTLRPRTGDTLVVDGNASVDGNALVKGTSRLQRELTFGTEGQTDDYVQNIKGCKIFWDGSGWMVEADYMNIHKKLYAKTIQVDEVTHVGGENILSDASCIADAVIPYTQNGAVVFWRVLFRKKNGEGKTVYNRWKRGDMAYCQVFNVQAGTTSDFENKYYWRKVIGTNIDPNPEIENDSFSSDEYHYIDLSNQAGEYDNAGVMRVDVQAGSIPAAEDPIIQVGYIASPTDDPATVIERQGVTIVSGGGQYKRSILMWEGIGGGTNPWTFPEPKVKLSPYDVRIIANKFLIKTDYGVTYQPPINRGVWANLPPETGQSDNLHRCYKDDIVQHNGATWICTYIQVSGQPAYTTEEPSESAANWQVYAQKGIDGTDADVWTIGQDGYWYKNGVKQSTKAEGKDGTGVEIKGSVATVKDLPATAGIGDCYVVDADRHLYSFTGSSWTDLGVFKGQDGTSSYMHIAYADNVTFDAQGNPTSATGFTITKQKEAYAWMGLCTNDSQTDPTTYTAYEWNKVKGAQGAQGTSVASVNINKPLLGINANSQGQAKQATTLYVRASLTVGSTQEVPLTNVVLSGAPTGVTATWIYQPYTQNAAAIITIVVPLNNSTFPSTLTVTLYGTDPTTGLTRSAQGAITLAAQKDGDNGEDAINPVLDPPSLLINQDITTGQFDLPIYSTLKVYKGGVDDSANATIEGVSATGCSATYEQNTKRIIINGWSTDAQGNYYQSATVNVVFLYGGTSRTIQLKAFANLVGTWKQTIEGDVNTAIAQKTTYTVNGHSYTVSENLGTFIQSSSESITKLEETVGDPEDPTSGTLVYRTSAIEQHVDRIDLSVAEGNRNLYPNPTFANYNPFVNGTNHETGTLVGSVEYGSTIGDYTSIWATEGAKLVALKVLTNTTTAATVLYANNSPTDNPRIRLNAGKTYTWSVLVAGDLDMIPAASSLVEGSLYNSETGDQRQSPWKYIRANSPILWQDSEWKQLYSTFEIPANSEYVWFSWMPLVAVLAGATGRIVYGGIRLEEGTKPTIINYSGTEDQLVKTGIDIKGRVIKFTTDNFIVENNDEEKTAWLDENGNLGTSGNIFTGMTVIDSLGKMQRFMPFDIDAYPDGFSLISHSEQRSGLTFLSEGQALVPDVFNLTDLVMIEDDYYGSSVHGNEPVQIVFPFIIPYEVVNQDGEPYTTGTPYFKADILKTKTTYKNTDSHFVTADEMAMLIDREFSVFFEQGSRYYHIILPSFTRDANGYVTDVPSYVGYAFSDIGGVTIHYEHLMFKFTINSHNYICDGVAPVLKYTQGSGSAFKYRVLDL